MELGAILQSFWYGIGWPLTRLMFYVSIGILVANFIEALNWTHTVARLSAPLIRRGRLPDTVGASFSMAFFSGVAANTMLSEAYDQGTISKKELILANLFNSLPTYFLHLPTVFFIALPLLKEAAFTYIGLTFFAALLRTVFILGVGRIVLRQQSGEYSVLQKKAERRSFRQAVKKTWKRFKKKIKKIAVFMVPIYCAMFLLNQAGLFDRLENFMATHLSFLSWLHPESISIVVFHVAAELAAGLAAAGALLDSGGIPARDIILALLVGNVISSPMRAVRHQFPYYAGIFSPRLAIELIIYSQSFRSISIILVGLGYYLVSG